jgi:hypothetical protein
MARYLSKYRYINMDKIITAMIWLPLHTIVSYDLGNPNHLIVVAKYHTHLQDIGCTNSEEPECWWLKIQYAIAKL